jgi:MoxR-like ATPase
LARHATEDEVALVNAALFLRRPLLITGPPGAGKSTLADDVAYELKLGRVLKWPINSRSTLKQGLYHYDAIARVRAESLFAQDISRSDSVSDSEGDTNGFGAREGRIGRHVRLGPLGTAMLPTSKPRVLLIDEIDKGDFDLPNDLLNIFEEGHFEIEELVRLPEDVKEVNVWTADRDRRAVVHRGTVTCHAFPFVVLTSNGERDFPPAFLRRCVRLDLPQPSRVTVEAFLRAHLDDEACRDAEHLIDEFMSRSTVAEMSTDQLLNAVYLATSGGRSIGDSRGAEGLAEMMIQAALRPLAQGDPG